MNLSCRCMLDCRVSFSKQIAIRLWRGFLIGAKSSHEFLVLTGHLDFDTVSVCFSLVWRSLKDRGDSSLSLL